MYDDWREETQGRLRKSAIYNELLKRCSDDPACHNVLQIVDDATYYSYQRTKTILIHMGEFTLHDGDHLFRVLNLMERILGVDNICKSSVVDLMLLILTAFFHDIGMAPDVKDVLAWKKVWDMSPVFESDEERKEYDKFYRYFMARPDHTSKLQSFLDKGEISAAEAIKSYLISDYIRITHADRARIVIEKDWQNKIRYRDVDLTVEFASICYSHNEDPFSIFELDNHYLCGPSIYANLQLVAVILRLADLLDFDAKRTPTILFSHLFVRNPVSLKEWAKHRAVEAWSIGSDIIQFHAKCSHPAIESSIHAFCDVIDKELSACNNILSKINEDNARHDNKMLIKVPFKVDRTKIETKKGIDAKPIYIYRETHFNLSKNQVIDLLMGTKLYGDPEVALREVLQNSIDACLLRVALERSWETPYKPEIIIRYSSKGTEVVLEIIDNGTGMDQNIIDSYYSRVGSSFYKSSEFYDLKSQSNAKFTPTSRFGIGILSCFMVADTLVVDTRRVYGPHDSSSPINLTIEGQESIFWIKPGHRSVPGTSTKMFLRESKNPWRKVSDTDFIKSVENVIPNPPFKIVIETDSESKTLDENTFWLLNSEDLKEKSWCANENIRQFELKFEDESKGFIGSATVAILESHGKPIASLEMTSKTVEIDGVNYDLERSMFMSSNEISESNTSITIDDSSNIDRSNSYRELAKSQSRLSFHGIEIPTTLFPHSWNMQKNQVKLVFPMPVLLVIDVCGSRDLDLNSSRTQVLMSDKWVNFEESITSEICLQIKRSVAPDYWCDLKDLLISLSKNSVFIRCINEVSS